VEEERPVAHGQDVRPVNSFNGGPEQLRVSIVDGIAGQINDHAAFVRLNDIESRHGATSIANGGGDCADTRCMIEFDAHGHRI
jgi:hypothetical protein